MTINQSTPTTRGPGEEQLAAGVIVPAGIDAEVEQVQFDPAATHQFATLFHALSDPTRLTILQHLSTGPHRVRDLVDHLGLAQSTVSTHLGCLRDNGLVDSVAQGRSSVFSLAAVPQLAALLRGASAVLDTAGVPASLCEHLMRGADREVS